MRQTMELGELIQVLAKRKLIIAVTTVLFLILGAIYSFFMVTPLYRAETTLMVSNSRGSVSPGESSGLDIGTVSVNQMMAVTYGEIVKSRSVLETVIEELGLNLTYEQFLSRITSEAVESTEILKISVLAESRSEAVEVADTITEVFIEEVVRVLNVNNVEVIDSAAATANPVNRSPITRIILAALAGFVLGSLIALIIDYRDNTIKTPEDIERQLDIPVIGSIPNFSSNQEKNRRFLFWNRS